MLLNASGELVPVMKLREVEFDVKIAPGRGSEILLAAGMVGGRLNRV